MKTKPFVYLATSLTHVPESERPDIATLVVYLKSHSNFLQWAFDPITWMPRKVDNIYNFDTAMVGFADFVAGVFWSSAGSDGRGAELSMRARQTGNRGMVIYIREGIKITPFITDMAETDNILVRRFESVGDLGAKIVLDALGSAQDEMWPVGSYNRQKAIEALDSGRHGDLISIEAAQDILQLTRKCQVHTEQELIFRT